jgi:ubiquitin-like modifier-activating enzyme ATG7
MQYQPFEVRIDATFWSQLSKLKLESGLTNKFPVYGTFSGGSSVFTPTISLPYQSNDEANEFANSKEYKGVMRGIIINCDSLSEFKQFNTSITDVFSILHTDNESKVNEITKSIPSLQSNEQFIQSNEQFIQSNEQFIQSNEQSIQTTAHSNEQSNKQSNGMPTRKEFILLTYLDIKNYKYYYWFCFPSITPKVDLISAQLIDWKQDLIVKNDVWIWSNDWIPLNLENIGSGHHQSHQNRQGESGQGQGGQGQSGEGGGVKKEGKIAFIDPSNTKHPGWTLRYILHKLAPFYSKLDIIAIRPQQQSILFKITLDDTQQTCAGWQTNSKGISGPRIADLKSLLSPHELSKSAIELNLKLMKWRLAPQLNLDIIHSQKCLIVGAGTVGCAIARNLLGWNCTNLTFIDSGKVAYSNPVRQSLFTLKQVGLFKADAIVQSLVDIYPAIKASGYIFEIPMPGHISSRENYEKLETLIRDCSLVFLATDTRESRWLPTVVSLLHSKPVINVALGFDSFLVQRHPISPPSDVKKEDLGCYFCSDIVAPRNSTVDRTLDQQCTVTRPGISNLAASSAVEMAISALQHPEGFRASSGGDGNLGSVAHTLRFFLGEWRLLPLTTHRFEKCVACAKGVLDGVAKGWDWVKLALADSTFIENASGVDLFVEMDVEWDNVDEDDF